MNVGLTRAKYACYVVGHLESLMVNDTVSQIFDFYIRGLRILSEFKGLKDQSKTYIL